MRTALFCLALLASALDIPAQSIVTGPGAGAGPIVHVFTGGTLVDSFYAFGPAVTSGLNVAWGDVNGDGVPDRIAGTGPGAGGAVSVTDGATGGTIWTFAAYEEGFAGGVYVASGDVNGDGYDDIITGPEGSAGVVQAIDGVTLVPLQSFSPFGASFTGGVTVASGDVDGDGIDDIIAGTASGACQVKAFNGSTLAPIASFFAFDPAFTGGVFVGAGDLDGDGHADIAVGAGPGGGPVVKVFSGLDDTPFLNFYAYAAAFTGGVRVALGDVNGDGVPDVITGTGSGSGPQVQAFTSPSWSSATQSFFAYDPAFTGGVTVGGSTPKPTATITGNSKLCSGSATISVSLTGRGPWTLTWSDGAVSSGIISAQFTRTVDSAGTYTITRVRDTNHGRGLASGTANVTAGSPPLVSFPPINQTIDAGSTATLVVMSFDATSYQWYYGDASAGQAIPGATSSSYTTAPLTHTTAYTVVMWNADCSTAAPVTVFVRPATPAGLDAHGTSTTAVGVTWSPVAGADHYELWRSDIVAGPLTTTVSTSFSNSGLTESTTYVYHIVAVDADGVHSHDSAPDPATTIVFADDSLSGVAVKAQHVEQLRVAANAFRAAAGLGAKVWTNPTLTPGITPVRAVDFDEIRTAVNDARRAIGLTDVSFTDATLDGAVPVRGLHVQELRATVH